jgi:hemerythrin-like metal-binding protein
MEWKENYNTGIKEIDRQHRKLVDIISQLQDSLSDGLVNKEMGKVLKGLVDYTRNHFRDEEALMRQIGFAEIATHKATHEMLINQIRDILLGLKGGKQLTAIELIEFLKKWLVEHILNEDMKLKEIFAERIKATRQDIGAEPTPTSVPPQTNKPKK